MVTKSEIRISEWEAVRCKINKSINELSVRKTPNRKASGPGLAQGYWLKNSVV